MRWSRLIALFGVFLAGLITTGVTAAEARDVYYSYDIMGRQLTAKFDSASGADGITNSYDAFGNLKTSTIAMAGFSKALNSDYDVGGRRTRLTHPDGQAFTYVYDGLDRLTGVYQGAGTTTSLDTFGYNVDGLLGSRTERLGSSVGYGYDPIGRLASLTDSFSAGTGNVTVGLGYNPASQIISQTRNNDSYAFGPREVNRNYAVNGLNQYSSAGAATFTYDANGNLTSSTSPDPSGNPATTTYVYDAEYRLTSATAAGQTTTLTYDPLGRLWQVVKGSANTRFLYDGDALVAEYDSAGTVTNRYVHGSNAAADDPLVWYQGSNLATTCWLHANHQGSIVGVTNSSGGSPSINTYDEYGVPNIDLATGNNLNTGRFQYTGQAWLGELGMYHYKARIYSPTLGRFLQTDPIGYDDQINLYAYVGNDPVNGVDPTGTYVCGGNKEQCAAAEKAINDVRVASRDRNLSRAERSLLSKISSFYGKAGQNNGAGVLFASQKQIQAATKDPNAAATVVRGPRTGIVAVILPKNFGKLFNDIRGSPSAIGRDLSRFSERAERAGVVAHEGKHGLDMSQGRPVREAPAYDAGRAVAKSMGAVPIRDLPEEEE